MRYIVLVMVSLWIYSVGNAQEIEVKKFKISINDSSAVKYPRLDLNDNPCSILKIESNEKNLVFEGNVIGEPEYRGDEIWVYVPHRSPRIRISHENYGVLRYEYPKAIEFESSYNLTLKFVKSKLDDKIRTLIIPFLGFCDGYPSYGAMIGIVRRTGFYLKYMGSFNSDVGSHAINESVDLYTGRDKQNWRGGTSGVIQRIWRPIYVYAGIGFISKNVYWETYGKGRDLYYWEVKDWGTSSAEWKFLSRKCFKGVAVEVGGVYRYRSIAASVALQTGGFEMYQVNFGIGIMY